MKKEVKGILIGFVIATLFFGTTNVFAATTQSITGVFGKVKLVVAGKAIDQETLLYNGTTYVPIRAAATALNKEVAYDDNTSTAYIDELGTNRTFQKQNTAPNQQNTTISEKAIEEERARIESVWANIKVDATLEGDVSHFATLEGFSGGVHSTYALKYENTQFDTAEAKKEAAAILNAESDELAAIRDDLEKNLKNGTLTNNKNLYVIYEEYINVLDNMTGIFAHKANMIAGDDPNTVQTSSEMISAYWSNIEQSMQKLKAEGKKLGIPLGESFTSRFGVK